MDMAHEEGLATLGLVGRVLRGRAGPHEFRPHFGNSSQGHCHELLTGDMVSERVMFFLPLSVGIVHILSSKVVCSWIYLKKDQIREETSASFQALMFRSFGLPHPPKPTVKFNACIQCILSQDGAQVVFAFLFQTLLLHEPTDPLSVAGSLLIAMWGFIALVKDSGGTAPSAKNEATLEEMMLSRRNSYELEHRDSEFDCH